MNTYVAMIPNETGGKQEHQFISPDRECAEALCDASGWELMGELLGTVEGADEAWKKEEPKKKAKRVIPAGNRLLSKEQKAALCQLAQTAFNHMDKYGLIEGVDDSLSKSKRMSEWRRMIVKDVTGYDSLTKCRNSDFRKIEAEFLKLGGSKYENPKAFQTGKQSKRHQDTMENRELAIFLMDEALEDHADRLKQHDLSDDAITQGYIVSIAKAQNKSEKLFDFDSLITLPADKLFNLLFTTKNRIASRERKLKLRD